MHNKFDLCLSYSHYLGNIRKLFGGELKPTDTIIIIENNVVFGIIQ